MLTIANDLITRSHVADMLNHADDIAEYHEYLDGLPMDDVERIENEIDETIARQCAIAESKGMTLDEYREDLADRRDMLLTELQFARVKFTVILT